MTLHARGAPPWQVLTHRVAVAGRGAYYATERDLNKNMPSGLSPQEGRTARLSSGVPSPSPPVKGPWCSSQTGGRVGPRSPQQALVVRLRSFGAPL